MFHLLRKNLHKIFIWGVVFAILAVVASLFFPRYYSAESQVLLISRGSGSVDPYTQAKAAERIGENLAQVIQTSDFYGKVMESGAAKFDKDRWQTLGERERRREWKKSAQASVVYGTGILKITTYSLGREDTLALADAVTQTLAVRGWEYVGGDVIIKIVNNPLLSRLPARPNYILNGVVGGVLGVLLSAWWLVRRGRHGLFGKF